MAAETFVFLATDKERVIDTIFIFRASYLYARIVRLINENGEVANFEENYLPDLPIQQGFVL